MSESKWTPGPWRPVLGNLVRIGTRTTGQIICGVHRQGRFTGRINSGETEANARLIAAAPDMAEALAWFADLTDEGFDPEGKAALERARAAIAKARGEP